MRAAKETPDGSSAVPILLYNTLTRSKEEFVPIHPGKVGMYTCGPTVYDHAHIGNLRTYVFEDVLRRVMEYNGLEVRHVMNLTDVGHLVSDADEGMDKMEKGARREGKDVWAIANEYIKAFLDDCERLNLEKPTIMCRATDHIGEQIGLVRVLEQKGYTYRTSDGIYFDTSKFEDYGRLARLRKAGIKAGIRVSMREKKNPTDFALWKFSPKDEKRQMEWESPWGVGFPGWHIECSAMSMKYLGSHFDIHTGGVDHIPVHHTNEIAQSEAATGTKFVNYWLHAAFLVVDGEKMAKSKGTFITLNQLVDKGFDPLDFRYFCFKTHYRRLLNFTWDLLDDSRRALADLRLSVAELRMAAGERPPLHGARSYDTEFLRCVNNDLDIRGALNVLHRLQEDVSVPDAERCASIVGYDKVLGLRLSESRKAEIPKEILALAGERESARKRKEWNLADELRCKIVSKGFEIEDTPSGYKITPRDH